MPDDGAEWRGRPAQHWPHNLVRIEPRLAIVPHDHSCVGPGKPETATPARFPCVGVPQHFDLRILRRQFQSNFASGVGRAVVDQQHFKLGRHFRQQLEDFADIVRQRRLAVPYPPAARD